MNPFTRHPHRQGVSYVEHWHFAAAIAWRLLKSAVAFGIHALLPFVSIPRDLDLEATAACLMERNRWIEGAAASVAGSRIHDKQSGSDPFLKTPCLVIHGVSDSLAPFSEGNHIVARIPGAKLVT